MDKLEQAVWDYIIEHPNADAMDVSLKCGVSDQYVQRLIDKIGSREPERIRLLEKGIKLTSGDRDKTYGPPWDNLTSCAQVWEAYLGAKFNQNIKLTAEDVAHMMQLVKMTRTFHGSYHADNYLDNAVYGAIAGECRKYEEQG